jgi:TolB-like protein/DNA-binding SARP family transcriptional activator/Flp pilus assembly protein TadD
LGNGFAGAVMIELHLLGSVDLKGSEGETLLSALAQPKRMALLAYLAAAHPNGCHRRDKLLGLFWPESDQEHGRGALRKTVFRLRRSLGEEVIVSRGDEDLGLAEGAVWCDAVAFEGALEAGRLEEALDLYRGDLLDGFFLSEAPEFDRWLESERERLRSRAAEAAWRLAERSEAVGSGVQAATWAKKAVSFAPDDEGTLRRLLELLDRVGDRAAAVKEYEAFARRLRDEYEAEPSPETQALIAAIREREVAAGGGSLERPVEARAGEARAATREPLPLSPPSARETERRPLFLPRVIATYAIVSVALLLSVHIFTLQFDLPGWFFPSAVVVLLACLPIIVATALVQAAAISARRAGTDATLPSAAARRWLTWRNASVVLLGGFALWGMVAGGSLLIYGRPSLSTLDSKSIAVLPLVNHSAEPDNEYRSDGITNDIITYLMKISDLKVIDFHSSVQYKGSEKTLREIADELGVDYILQGGMQREGGGVRINVQLVDATSGDVLWAEQYTRELTLTGVFEIQSDVVRQIVVGLQATLTPAEEEQIERAPTDDLAAYEYYWRGNVHFYRSEKCYVEEECRSAVQMYEQAVGLDPAFALAYAWLANAHAILYGWGYDLRSERLARAKEAAERAVQLQPDLSEAHWALGRVYYFSRDYSAAMNHFRTALAIQPRFSNLLFSIGLVWRRWGEWEAAATSMSEALELDPRDVAMNWDVATTYFFMRNYAEAERYFDRAISLAPDVGLAYGVKSLLYLNWEGSVEKARQALQGKVDVEAAPRRWGRPWMQAWVAYLDVHEGHYQEALERLSLGSDTITHYFAKASIYHLSNQPQLKHAYSDSLRMISESRVEEHPNEARFHGILGIAYAGLNRKEDAIREGQKAVELLPVSEDAFYGTAMLRNLAAIFVMAGEHDAAIDRLEQLLSIPSALSAAWLRVEPIWQPLRSNPRFQALLERYE